LSCRAVYERILQSHLPGGPAGKMLLKQWA
jgi:hypothetical protein